MKTDVVALAGLVFGLVGGVEAFATVIEFDRDGSKTIVEIKLEKSHEKPAKTNSVSVSASQTKMRDLTREVAIKYSGAVGVKKARLDAWTFVNLFEALVEAESNFNPLAVSEKGAQGLGQLMPTTAEELKIINPFDPKQNLEGSARYFTQLLQRFASVELAIAAYNAGPGRVDRYGGIPPFPETKSYVAKLLTKVGLLSTAGKPNSSGPTENASEGVTEPVSNKSTKDQPLTGEISVWEF